MLLVTCATGNVGGAVLAELAQAAVPVRAFVRNVAKLKSQPSNVQVVQGDILDDAALARAFDGVEAAFLAADFSPRMAELHARCVAAAKAAGVQRIVQLSGVGANPKLCCSRGLRWLGQVENTTRDTGLPVTYLRPTYFMQNLLRFASGISQGVIAGPFRSARWTFVDARDVGAVAAQSLLDPKHAGQTYTVTGSESLTYHEIAERLTQALGKPIRYHDITANEARGRLQADGMPPVMIEALIEFWDACASNFINVAPTNVVKDVTGREPRTLDDFAREYRERLLQPTTAEFVIEA